MQKGKVKWFDNAKGYGFIRVEGVEEDIFVHHSTIDMDGFRTLKADESVRVWYQRTPKGLSATRVVRRGR